MLFRCEHDGNEFTAEPKPYPNTQVQTKCFDPSGDTQIVCPKCKRAYLHHAPLGVWMPGRPLSVLEAVS